ncbi:MAG: hypothetical protein AAF564_21350 [Bacteroidota bacterium]
MINFYRKPRCTFCDEVEEKLQHLVVAHKVHALPATDTVIYLTEGKRMYQQEDEIQAFLRQIGHEMLVQREMQGDSCKIDPDTGLSC